MDSWSAGAVRPGASDHPSIPHPPWSVRYFRCVPFLSQIAVRRIYTNRWRLLEDLCYRGKHDTFTAPAGFVTDFATVPSWAQSFVARTGRWDEAAVIHDLCCEDLARYRRQLRAGHLHPRRPWATARQTDAIFRRIMREYGVGIVRRWLIWTAVRWGALLNPARQPGWHYDAPAVLGITAATLTAAYWVIRGVDAVCHWL